MKTLLFLATFMISVNAPMLGKDYNNPDSVNELREEVVRIFEKYHRDIPDADGQEVSIGFIINAKNELVIMDVQGNSPAACDYVKKVLNYRKVKYQQSKQLTGYTLKIHLVKDFTK